MLTELFCSIDDFLNSQKFNPVKAICLKKKPRNRTGSLSTNELATLISYSRFIQLMPRVLMPIASFLKSSFGKCSGISIIDSTSINVCHNRRIMRNKVFSGLAERGKSTMGWFFGFKVHLITNDRGELLSVKVTKGNVDDRQVVLKMVKNIFGKLFGDNGYLSSSISEKLSSKGLSLITTIKKNMKNKIMLRKRFIIETINDKLKNECQIEHTRHRSPMNFLVNLLAGLTCYQMSPKKPALKIPSNLNKIFIA
jgi:hypothetical protein